MWRCMTFNVVIITADTAGELAPVFGCQYCRDADLCGTVSANLCRTVSAVCVGQFQLTCVGQFQLTCVGQFQLSVWDSFS